MVRSLADKPSWPPRPRVPPTKPAPPGRPPQGAPASRRAGARHVLAAWATRTGPVEGPWDSRKRQSAGSAGLASRAAALPPTRQTLDIVCDNVATPHGQAGRAWWQRHPRVVCHVPPWAGRVDEARGTVVCHFAAAALAPCRLRLHDRTPRKNRTMAGGLEGGSAPRQLVQAVGGHAYGCSRG
jgi:hypothetical protein